MRGIGQSTFALSSVKGSNGIVLDIDRTFTPEQQ